jgi:hypothetical protein
VLRGFRDHGQAHRVDLHPTAAALGVDIDDALDQLASADLVHTAPDGAIEIAYPFSGRPTGHTVHLAGHPPVAAMCAIDALGIPLMTGSDGVIDSADPDTGTPIRVQRRGDEWTWQPATAVVVICHTDCCGILANSVCRSITFHTDPQHAQSHLDNHPELQGLVISQIDALARAERTFGSLLGSCSPTQARKLVTSDTDKQNYTEAQCWCRGSQYPDTDLLRLGQHPEVGICPRCARWLRRRAIARHDEQHHSLAGRLRGVLQGARDHVISHGWHQRRLLGALLRRLDQHLP